MATPWPATLRPSRMSFGLRANTQVFTSPLNGAQQTLELPGAAWVASLAFERLKAAERAELAGFLAGLRGAAGRFDLWDHARETPQGGDQSIAAATNLALQSADLGTAPWALARANIPAGTQTAPDGTNTAKSLFEDATSPADTHFALQNISVVNATQYTYSVFAQAGGRSQLRLEQLGSGSFAANTYADYDLTAKTAVAAAGADAARISEPVPGWYRCELTATAIASALATHRIYLMTGGLTSYISAGGSGLALWGAQMEVGALASPHVPTTTVAASRPAGPVVKGAGQAGNGLLTWGWPADGAAPLTAGDYLAVGGELKLVTAAAVTDAVYGQAQITVEPPLRSAPADNAAVTINKASGTFRLADDGQAQWRTRGPLSSFSVSAIEALA